jgi:hypothetical protein
MMTFPGFVSPRVVKESYAKETPSKEEGPKQNLTQPRGNIIHGVGR